MKILIINKNEISGGSAQVCQELINNLSQTGHSYSLFVDKKETNLDNVIKIYNHPIKKVLSYFTSNDLDYYYGDNLLKTEEFKNCDLVNLHNISGHFFKLATIKKIAKQKPIIWTFHDMHPINHYFAHSLTNKLSAGLFTGSSPKILSNIIWWNKLYLKWRKISIYKNTYFKIIAPSHWLAEKIKLTAIKKKSIQVIHNGIDENVFNNEGKNLAKEKLNLNKDQKLIITICDGGSKNLLKGWGFIEKAANNFPDIKFYNIGNENSQEKNNITFLKKITDKNILRTYYQAADLLLFPSLAENFPLSILESMSCGTPVVAFDAGGIKEQIDNKINGYIARYKDAEDLLKGIEFIYSSDYKKMSEACRKKITENFTSKIMSEKYIKLFEKTIKEYETRY